MEIVMIFEVEIKSELRRERVVMMANEGKTRIVDITILEKEIRPTSTSSVVTTHNQTITTTNDIQTLQQNS